MGIDELVKKISEVLHDHVESFEDCPYGIDGHYGKEKNYVAEKIVLKMHGLLKE